MKVFSLIISICICFSVCSCNDDSEDKQNNTPEQSVVQLTPNDTLAAVGGVFEIPELQVSASPNDSCEISFLPEETVIDYNVSPAGQIVAVIVKKNDKSFLRFWQLSKPNVSDSCPLPVKFQATAISWHPMANALFVMGKELSQYRIYRVEKHENNWSCKSIYASSKALCRLIACPRPFITGYDSKSQTEHYAYRLFFGIEYDSEMYRIVSITEQGGRFYQVVGPADLATPDESLDAEMSPSQIESKNALPVAFHPAGHELIWQDNKNKYHVSIYSRYWRSEENDALKIPISNGGTITPTPNGLGFIRWQKNKIGIGVYLIPTKSETTQLSAYQFVSTPSSVPDGKGIVGLCLANDMYSLRYLPVKMPLSDVLNAWMFVHSGEELGLFQTNFGLFRPNNGDQMFQLYETENYACSSYDRNSPTRPYIVTTDVFWELFGAAYQGLFIVKERDESMPQFWQFVDAAGKYYAINKPNSKWNQVFKVLSDFKINNIQNIEVQKILDENDDVSSVTDEMFMFTNLKPRGHYSATPEMSQYFKAFNYFTAILNKDQASIEELSSVPTNIANLAKSWISSYSGFIAPSRAKMVWLDDNQVPAYCKYPTNEFRIFPLSWGFDNEVFYSTVYHPTVSVDLQVTGSRGPRLIPSGLDIAAVFGNSFADKLLQNDFNTYPSLRKVINNLKANFQSNKDGVGFTNNLYNKWLNCVAIQWSDTVHSSNGLADNALWQTKRLQTGLATWATLRHATVLVNERTAAECGEGGFEELLMRAPRGYVEPDPQTFAAIASLFEASMNYVSNTIANKEDIVEYTSTEKRSLYEGIIARLKDAASEARQFQAMAEKERRGEELSDEENEKILYTARISEHLFLVFNSLSNKDYALSIPDPMPKIADVAGGSPYLLAAVGQAMEWDYVVPFYGRRQIVKGSIYSYYEFQSALLLNDQEWRERVKMQDILTWIKPFTCKLSAADMPATAY